MQKLKNKVFYTILGIFTFSILSFIVVFNIQNYLEQKEMIKRNLSDSFFGIFQTKDAKGFDRNIRFMDSVVYTILLDINDEVIEIINHSNNNDTQVTNIVKDILKQENIPRERIGSILFDDYSYAYNKGRSLVIVNNENARERVLSEIKTSLIIFVILEIIVVYISKIITNWIIKPVEETFKKQKEFIADASHELKTPLSVIVASSEALEDNPKEKKWLINIKNEAERMNNLIKDLLDLAKLDSDFKLTLNEGDLSHAVNLSVLTFEGRAYEKNIKLKANIDDNITMLMNENSIRQLVEILLDNAIKHSKEKGTVQVSLKKNNNIELLVINEGDAIPKGEEEKIFERFYRVDKARNRNDNRYGLGLAIAKSIVENHNGMITALSNNGKTIFKVIFKK